MIYDQSASILIWQRLGKNWANESVCFLIRFASIETRDEMFKFPKICFTDFQWISCTQLHSFPGKLSAKHGH